MASLSGYGQTGPYSRFVNYGPQIGSQSGLYAMSGYPQDRPREGPVAYGDPSMGLWTAYLINTALIHRKRTGEGQYFDLAMWEALEMLSPDMLLEFAMNRRDPKPAGNHDAAMSPHNCYKALGDAENWVAIAVGSEAEWQALCAAIGQPSLSEDPRFCTAPLRKRNETELDRLITQWTAQRDRWEITEILQRRGVAAFPTLNNRDPALDPHLAQRGFLVQLEHPEVGVRIHSRYSMEHERDTLPNAQSGADAGRRHRPGPDGTARIFPRPDHRVARRRCPDLIPALETPPARATASRTRQRYLDRNTAEQLAQLAGFHQTLCAEFPRMNGARR